MKRKILVPLMAILLIGVISAGIGIGALAETRELDKAERDILLTKTDEGKIEPAVTIRATDDYVLWNAYQEGIINSRDNKIQTYYMNCTLYNETTNECETEVRIDLTDNEIQDMVTDAVTSRLSNYAKAEIGRASEPTDWGTGTITIEEKK